MTRADLALQKPGSQLSLVARPEDDRKILSLIVYDCIGQAVNVDLTCEQAEWLEDRIGNWLESGNV